MFEAIDLFCGAGGITNGLKDALHELGYSEEEIALVAINHWNIAIATHSANHPNARHLHSKIENIDPREIVPSGHLDILVAGPQCTYYSRARGGQPVTDQQRISPWGIIDWLEKLDVDNFLIENVPELMKWGPIDPKTKKPIKRLEGKIFLAYIKALKALGYNVDFRLLTCADYGDATTRQRLFILGRKNHRIKWPAPTHSNKSVKGQMTFVNTKTWRPAREIINWSVRGKSIYNRKKPLSPNTLRRIEAGLMKYSGLPFTVSLLGEQNRREFYSIDKSLPTILTENRLEPYLIQYNGTADARSIDEPLGTQTTKDRFGLVQPIVIKVGDDRYMLDILFRMLLPEELAAAMSFPKNYIFIGTREETVKQIGNAVPRHTAKALCKALLEDKRKR